MHHRGGSRREAGPRPLRTDPRGHQRPQPGRAASADHAANSRRICFCTDDRMAHDLLDARLHRLHDPPGHRLWHRPGRGAPHGDAQHRRVVRPARPRGHRPGSGRRSCGGRRPGRLPRPCRSMRAANWSPTDGRLRHPVAPIPGLRLNGRHASTSPGMRWTFASRRAADRVRVIGARENQLVTDTRILDAAIRRWLCGRRPRSRPAQDGGHRTPSRGCPRVGWALSKALACTAARSPGPSPTTITTWS